MGESVKWAELKPYEQDELVHEHVMHGKCPCHALPGVGYIPNAYYVWECGKCKANNTNSAGTYRNHDSQVLPQYSCTWDAAWEVIREIEQHDELHAAFAYHLGATFATPEGFDTFRVSLEQLAKLTPEKICKAALKAAGVKIE